RAGPAPGRSMLRPYARHRNARATPRRSVNGCSRLARAPKEVGERMGLRVALVGAGQVASVHLEALRETEAVELVGIYDQDLARATERAEANGIPRAYASWEELLSDEASQCVGVLLPHDLHERFAVEALSAGKHVVCEK